MRFRDTEHRLLARSVVIPEGEPHAGCWMWMGRVEPNGYAKLCERVEEGPRNVWVHRLAYEVFHGVHVPEEFDVHHKCLFTLCIRPEHIEAVPSSINRRWGAINGARKRAMV